METQKHFLKDIKNRLRLMRKVEPRPLYWPEGCYGSAMSWLMFVGPSPGGKLSAKKISPRNPKGGQRLWNTEFNAPYSKGATGWPGKYRANIPVLVSTIIGVPLEQGSGKLYGFANFDWVPSPKEPEVSTRRMKQGEKDVLAVLKSCRPQVIAPMTKGSYTRLIRCLRREGYLLFSPATQRVRIRIDPLGKSYHRNIEVVKLLGKGVLAGSVVVRLPQHPARMLFKGHGQRCAQAVRETVIQVFQESPELVINEK